MNQSKLPTESSETQRSGEGAKSKETRKPGDIELTEEALNKVAGAGTLETHKQGDIKLTEEALNKVAGAGTISARR
jgi:hypothetical protein